ncbi:MULTISPECIES: WXG100 family type VII secretion target [Prauserella salsuginis group]|uniref:ESAT-6-like protein n=2 Tax=Prauserella salsuginis group TaxID=2893672 RepID=A0A839XN20_9PSEU|nr:MULTISPECIES: WXG100 family type VII secretion target [Prauserella salsuginis group]MBB3662113.1 WXG100 family type VII secretion target [Prauserella sediminis]MCR3719805.1 WXG100 family type VII secretion target [Prauserella flava]MCR3736652.1 WXG100 family type VII secretion target [Prauserella salsuginis]
MAGGFAGTPEQFQKAFQDVSETKGQMDANMQKLRSNIEATSAGWQGEAAGAFQNVMAAFDEKNHKLNQALQDIADLLQQSGHKYQQAEEEQNSAISNIGNVLGGL